MKSKTTSKAKVLSLSKDNPAERFKQELQRITTFSDFLGWSESNAFSRQVDVQNARRMMEDFVVNFEEYFAGANLMERKLLIGNTYQGSW
ncbi:MAG: hypothetical protein HY966_02735 [Ignavibacteriales bacterium]|nr:hypothetical protein [Ignavibacteriales bacterium]